MQSIQMHDQSSYWGRFSTEPPSIKSTGNFYKLIMTSWLECPVTGHSSNAYTAEIKDKII